MKVLFTTQALTIGGIEVLALRLSEAFGKAGHEVLLYDFNPEWSVGNGLTEQYDNRYFRILSFYPPKAVHWSVWKINALLAKAGLHKEFRGKLAERHFAAIIKKERPDVICSLSFHQDYISCKHATPLGIPVVVSMHGTYEYASPEWPQKAAYIYEHVAAIIYAADKNLSWYKEQGYYHSQVPEFKIYTGTDLSRPITGSLNRADLNIAEDSFVYIMVARGIKEKGWQEVLDAFCDIHARDPKTVLLLVGDGAYLDELQEQYGKKPGIIFYGTHPNSIVLTALANVGLLPSYFPIETMPNVIVDYLRCGLPVIVSDIGEIPEMLRLPEGGTAGRVLKRNGTKGVDTRELKKAMETMMEPETYQQEVKLARQVAQKFDIRDCVARYTAVFEIVCRS